MLLIQQEAGGGGALVRLEGALRAPDCDHFTHAIQALVRDRTANVVLDLEDVIALDAAGIGALVTARNLVAGQGGRLAILKTSRHALTMLAVLGLLSIFEISVAMSIDERDSSTPPVGDTFIEV